MRHENGIARRAAVLFSNVAERTAGKMRRQRSAPDPAGLQVCLTMRSLRLMEPEISIKLHAGARSAAINGNAGKGLC